jgi:opacity protein-like surface antigen
MKNRISIAAAMTAALLLANAAAAETTGIPGPLNIPQDPYSWALFSYAGRAGVDAGNLAPPGGEAGMFEFDALAGIPLLNQPWGMLALGAGFNWTGISFFDLPLGDLDLYAISLPVDLVCTSLVNWTFWVNATPGIFSDLKHVSRDDYGILAHAMALYAFNQRWQCGLGASYDREFGNDRLYPLGGVIWTPVPEWQVKLLLPYPEITWAPTPDFLLYLDARPAGNKWNTGPEDDGSESDFRLESWRLAAGLEKRIYGQAWLHLGAGLDFDRAYKINTGGDTVLDAKADDTWFARIGIVLQ